jgi:hypothetical protein
VLRLRLRIARRVGFASRVLEKREYTSAKSCRSESAKNRTCRRWSTHAECASDDRAEGAIRRPVIAHRCRSSFALLVAIAASSCGRSKRMEYVDGNASAGGIPGGSGGSAGQHSGGGSRDEGAAIGESGAAGSTHDGTLRARSPESASTEIGSAHGGSGSGGAAAGHAGHGGSEAVVAEGGHSAQGGSPATTAEGGHSAQAGSAQAGSAQAGSPHAGSAQGGSAQGGSAQGGTDQGGTAQGGATGGGSAGKSSSGGIGGYSYGPCPTATPVVGSACATDRRICTWGDSGLPECRTFLVCSDGHWVKGTLPGVVGGEPGFGSVCNPPPASACPNYAPADKDCTAELDGARCQYSDGNLCTCLVKDCSADGCTPLPSPEWTCNQILPPCPGKVPNSGTSCTGPDGSCTYEYSSLAAQCINGIWEWQLYWPE